MVSAVISAVSAFGLIRASVRSPHQRTALMTRLVLRLLVFAKAETGALSAWRFLTLMRPFFAVFVVFMFLFVFCSRFYSFCLWWLSVASWSFQFRYFSQAIYVFITNL